MYFKFRITNLKPLTTFIYALKVSLASLLPWKCTLHKYTKLRPSLNIYQELNKFEKFTQNKQPNLAIGKKLYTRVVEY